MNKAITLNKGDATGIEFVDHSQGPAPMHPHPPHPKVVPQKYCACGRRISSNKSQCFACKQKDEKENAPNRMICLDLAWLIVDLLDPDPDVTSSEYGAEDFHMVDLYLRGPGIWPLRLSVRNCSEFGLYRGNGSEVATVRLDEVDSCLSLDLFSQRYLKPVASVLVNALRLKSSV